MYSKAKIGQEQDPSETAAISFGLLKVEERFDLDFTEQLWSILKGELVVGPVSSRMQTPKF